MNDVESSATELVRSVLGEAYQGAAAAVLQKYHLLDEATGELRQVTLEGDRAPGPIVDPEVFEKFLALDKSAAKRAFEWMIFASGGGEPHIKESEKAMELAKNWVVENRMKGKGRNEEDIKPMSRQEAEADWAANDEPKYKIAYFYADQDLASDKQYPVFGWFRKWPGRHNVYQKVVDGVTRLFGILKDKKMLSEWNRLNPNNKLLTDMGALFWQGDAPKFKDADALVEFVSNIKSTLARRRAEGNIQFVGRVPAEQGGGYRTGPNEVLYDDEVLTLYVPLTAAASLKKGYNDWCVSNRTRWETYFRTRQQNDLMWGTYTQRGPFGFLHMKPKMRHDAYLQTLAAHIQLDANPNTAGRIQWWDQQNQAQVPSAQLMQRLEREVPGSSRSVKAAIKEMEEWLKEFKREQLERFPPLEHLMAKALVAALID